MHEKSDARSRKAVLIHLPLAGPRALHGFGLSVILNHVQEVKWQRIKQKTIKLRSPFKTLDPLLNHWYAQGKMSDLKVRWL